MKSLVWMDGGMRGNEASEKVCYEIQTAMEHGIWI